MMTPARAKIPVTMLVPRSGTVAGNSAECCVMRPCRAGRRGPARGDGSLVLFVPQGRGAGGAEDQVAEAVAGGVALPAAGGRAGYSGAWLALTSDGEGQGG
jgi:hypothetical protein